MPYRPNQVPTIIEKGRAVLRARRHVPFNKPDDFAIYTPDKLIESFQGITRGVTLGMIFIAFISLLIGGVGVMNIMLVSVTERTREIGVRKAVGAFRRDIVLQFLTEATTLSLLGGVIGVIVGVAVPAGVKRRLRGPAGGDAALGDRRRAARLAFRRDLLRPLSRREGVAARSHRSPAVRVMKTVLSGLRRGFGENVRFALLAVRAHKLRAGLTILGIVVGVATVIAMVSIVTGFNNNMVRNFQSFGATLVMFQKYEPRFGPGGPRPEGSCAART